MRGYWSIALKEFLHLRRDPTTLVIALLIPIIQLTLFGFAIDFDIRHIPTVVVDMDRSRESRAYVDSLRATQYLDVTAYRLNPDEAMDSLRRGTARVALIIPPDFARRQARGEVPSVRVMIDGSDNQVATRARFAVIGVSRGALTPRPPLPRSGEGENGAATLSALPSPVVGGGARGGGQGVDARIDMVFNPDMRTTTFMIPGLIGVILQLVTVSLTAFSLVREREQGTLEQLMVSPVGRLGLMLGKLTPYAGLAMVEMAAVLLIGWMVFDVRVVGSLALLLLLALPFVIAALAMGLLISTIAQNQAQALQITVLITMPSILMSGFVFPRETMPGALYLLSMALPVTHFLDILRGIVVRGTGYADVQSSVAALLIITAILLLLSTTRFRKSID